MMRFISFLVVALLLATNLQISARADETKTQKVVQSWYKLFLELVRHTPTYSPPVASRSFAYVGVTAYEAVASGSNQMQTLVGQLNGLTKLPKRHAGESYDDAVVLEAAMAFAAQNYFSNTGPTGQHVMEVTATKLGADVAKGVPKVVVLRSAAFGKALALAVFNWSKNDGGAVVESLGFASDYKLNPAPGHWAPTNTINLQQLPLLPHWGQNRTFAMPQSASCALAAPPEYSEDKNSEFYKQALEVYNTSKSLTPEQKATAKFWADDAMLSTTPPGHWISIALQIFERDRMPIEKRVDVLARLGVVLADSFIGCWNTKYQYDLVRPITYIRKVIDPKWSPLINTPPFPEYPSGHSTQSGAAATVLTDIFGEHFAFSDDTVVDDGSPLRNYPDFWAAANEAGISRLYGGIHFRAAIDRGIEQGQCIAKFTNSLKTLKKKL